MEPGRPLEALRPLLQQLEENLSLESKFQANLQLPTMSQDGNEVTVGIRDGSAHVLRCLKVWYDLPSDVFFVAANLMDRFLTKMKVRPKHMACISVASFQLGVETVVGRGVGPEAPDILSISQCPCTPGDLARMQAVIASKLPLPHPSLPHVTPLIFLRLFNALFSALDVNSVYQRAVKGERELVQRLEVAACDSAISNFRASEVALVLLCSQLDTGVAALDPPPPQADLLPLLALLGQLQQLSQISDGSFYACHGALLGILARYDAQLQTPNRQRLVWRLSQRTLRRLRPTDRLVTTLPTIDEHGQLQTPPKPSGTTKMEGLSWNSD